MRLCYSNKEFLTAFDRQLRYVYFILASFLFCLPLLILLFNRADFMVIANESLAYRFIYSIRLHQGPDAGAWLPQGHLITSIHHIITWFLIKTDGLSNLASLRKSLNLFGFSSLGFDCIMMCSIFFASIKISYLGWRERYLLALTALVPMFFMGFYHPDYYHLNVVLAAFSVFLFQIAWFYPRDDQSPFSLKICAGVGFFSGLLASNKVSMLAIGFPLLGLMAFSSPIFSCKDVIKRILVMAVCIFFSFSLVFMAAGLFQIDWLKNTLFGWLKFISNPGSEPNFTEQFFKYYLGYFGTILFLFFTTTLMMIFNGREEKYSLKFKVVKYAILSAAFFCIYSLWKRPAGTTFGEVATILFGLAAISATIISKKEWTNKALLIFFLTMSMPYLNQYFLANIYNIGQNSSKKAGEKWNFATSLPKNQPIFLLIPDNRYCSWGDPFELFLKGASDFPTWTISENGQKLLQKFFLPRLIYYTEQSSDSAASKMLNKESLTKLLSIKSGVVFWADPDGLLPVTEHYPLLKEAIQKSGVKFTSEYLPLSKVTINILEIHSKST